MKRAQFRFYAELNDFLPPARRGAAFAHQFEGRPSVKDVIESLGVPHGEIDLILANGESVDFSWMVQDGARVSVYPVFESIDISPLARVRPTPLRETRFVVDGRLGRLARYLRMAGFDARWRRDCGEEELVRIAVEERRILLTRDVGLLERPAVTHGHWVREIAARRQLAEVLRRFDLSRSVAPFRRCLRCNDLLQPAEKEVVERRMPPPVRQPRAESRLCPSCGRIYWKGSHHGWIERLVAEVAGFIT